MRIRKHEFVQLLRDFRQPKSESYLEYCDRAERLRSDMGAPGLHTDSLNDSFTLGLSEPFRSNNRDRLYKISDEKGLDALLSDVRMYTRLSTGATSNSGHVDLEGAALPVEGRSEKKQEIVGTAIIIRKATKKLIAETVSVMSCALVPVTLMRLLKCPLARLLVAIMYLAGQLHSFSVVPR
jgi:hypothetical protein